MASVPGAGRGLLAAHLHGRKSATAGFVAYFACDAVLRSAAVAVLGYAAGRLFWLALGAFFLVQGARTHAPT